MVVDVVVLNGGSSSGKSSIARNLQMLLGPTWLTLSVDDLIQALPGGASPHAGASIAFEADGTVVTGDDFRRAEAAWYQGLAAIGRAGTGLIIDDVFLDGGVSQQRLCDALSGLKVAWVGVRCAVGVAAAREQRRLDRIPGMAKRQAEQVHRGVYYDLTVDTTTTGSARSAHIIATKLRDLDPAQHTSTAEGLPD